VLASADAAEPVYLNKNRSDVVGIVVAIDHTLTANPLYLKGLKVPVGLRGAEALQNKDLFGTHLEHSLLVA
jgi:hypothetical protein